MAYPPEEGSRSILRNFVGFPADKVKKFLSLLIKYKPSEKFKVERKMEFYKVVARPSLLYGSETWVTTQ